MTAIARCITRASIQYLSECQTLSNIW